ncbi:threonine dehydratase [Cribrihabitans pelagius]|uniref:threonine dehydratase n=1 Tax=Cribrihabitans pelagius TaxID=1765746 RepID=UPI003B5C3513
MKSWSIFSHSIGMVLRNFQQAVQIGLVPLLIAFGVGAAVLILAGKPLDSLGGGQITTETAGGLGLVTVALAVVLCMLWIVVSWHRFVLLEEYPQGWVPPFRFDRILSYLGHGAMIVILSLFAIIPVGLVVGMAAASGLQMLIAIVVAAASIAMGITMYRLLPILPAAAIGVPLKLKEAWAATEGANGTMFGLCVIVFLFGMLVQLASVPVAMVPVLGPMVSFAASLVVSLVNVSVMTTLYGHYVEGRPV